MLGGDFNAKTNNEGRLIEEGGMKKEVIRRSKDKEINREDRTIDIEHGLRHPYLNNVLNMVRKNERERA